MGVSHMAVECGSTNELGRAAAFLMGIHPKRLCASCVSSSSTSALNDGRSSSFPPIPCIAHNLTETPLTSMKSQTDDEHNALASLLTVDDPLGISPQLSSNHYQRPREVSFLSTIGEMAKRVAQQHRHAEPRPVSTSEPKSSSRNSCIDAHAMQAPLTVEHLVHTEGQGVRMRLVPMDSDTKRHPEHPRYGPPTTLCTILSSFAPPQASYWQDDRLVQPYSGERCGQMPRRGDDGSGDEEWAKAHDTKDAVSGMLYSGDTGVGYESNEESVRNGGNDVDGSEREGSKDGSPGTFSPSGGGFFSKQRGGTDGEMRSYRKLIGHHRCRQERVFYDAHFLDTGNITGGERRKKLIVLPSYRASIISFVDRKVLKKDINNDFYVQHPELEIREIKLTHMRAIRADLLNFSLKEGSPIEVVTAAHANWYFERLIMRGMVGKRNRRLMLAVCVLLAIKFIETGDIQKKINYAKTHLRQDEMFAGVTWQKVQECEFRVYVGLDFTLMPEKGNNVVETHLERLLGQINVTFQEYYSKNFAVR